MKSQLLSLDPGHQVSVFDWFHVLLEEISERSRQLKSRQRLGKLFPDVTFCGDGYADSSCVFEDHVTVHAGSRLINSSIGRYSYIAPNCRVKWARIGKFCSIGPGVHVGLGRHPSRGFVSCHPAFYATHNAARVSFVTENVFEEFVDTHVGSDVWIGMGALVLDGVRIGNGAIIGARAVVTRDVAPFAVVGGVPAKLIRFRFSEEQIAFLNDLHWWDKDVDWIREHAPLFRDINQLSQNLGYQPENTL
ncbi:MAG: CatB-related O-acetyltransferase [Nitrospirae bacterium]|nr:CatB-related O-acetyltransferase [Nitrospirota bacterium]